MRARSKSSDSTCSSSRRRYASGCCSMAVCADGSCRKGLPDISCNVLPCCFPLHPSALLPKVLASNLNKCDVPLPKPGPHILLAGPLHDQGNDTCKPATTPHLVLDRRTVRHDVYGAVIAHVAADVAGGHAEVARRVHIAVRFLRAHRRVVQLRAGRQAGRRM
jgi:hypothetical protein